MVQIADTPDVAYEICTKIVPDCPLGANLVESQRNTTWTSSGRGDGRGSATIVTGNFMAFIEFN